MAENSLWWTTGGAGDGAAEYTQDEWIIWLRTMFAGDENNEGVCLGVWNDLACTGATSPVEVNTGVALCHGFPYFNDSAKELAIPTPTVNTRIDLIVARATEADREVRLKVHSGVEGAGAPALTQNDGVVWEIPLWHASITIGGVITLTDVREYIHPSIAVKTSMIDALAVTLAKMAANSVDSDQYVDGSIDLAHMSPNSVDSPQYVDGSIDRVHLVADIVDGTKIADDAVNSEHIAAGAVDLEHMSPNSVDSPQYVDGSIDRIHLEADIIDGTKIADDAVDSEHIAAGAVDLEHMSTDSVDSPQYVNRSIDTIHIGLLQVTAAELGALAAETAKINNLAVTSGKLGPDAVIAGKIADGAVDITASLANDIVDDTKVGNRVPQFYRRQGGHVNEWNWQGTTTYTPSMVRMQAGVIRWTGGAANLGNVVVTFPVAFSDKPIVFVTLQDATSAKIDNYVLVAANQATIYWEADALHTQMDFAWLAIGPE